MERFRGARTLAFWILGLCGLLGAMKLATWAYTSHLVNRALAEGVYPTAAEAFYHLMEEHYTGVKRIDIIYAGPNDSEGNQPYVWYVVAEVRADKRADGSQMGKNGCDNPGVFFMQSHEGWFYVPESLLTGLIGDWMREYGLAGPGQTTPAIGSTGGGPMRFCQ